MIKRTIEISREPCTLCVDHGQLVLLPQSGVSHPRLPPAVIGDRRRIPCEDVGLLVVDERDTMYSHNALTALLDSGAAVVLCGRDHLPAGVLLPFGSHTEILWRLEAQLAMKKPVGKRLWQQIVRAKIKGQAANLSPESAARRRLERMAREVRSGDAGHHEAQAARAYWSALFDGIRLPGGPFRRVAGGGLWSAAEMGGGKRKALPPNHLLDYGYAVMRAGVARALVGSGLFPAIGLRHAHRSNAFALADDLVEPLRPIVDARVRELARARRLELDSSTKAELLILLTATVRAGESEGPLQAALPRYTASLVRCLEGEHDVLEIPEVAGDLPEAAAWSRGMEEGRKADRHAGRGRTPGRHAGDSEMPAPHLFGGRQAGRGEGLDLGDMSGGAGSAGRT